MKAIRFALAIFFFSVFSASLAQAQLQRTFVSGLGSDSNPCTRTAPCRTFAKAVSGTNAAGEVIALDSAGYGPFAITKSVSIIAAPGAYAGISVFSGDGIDINAGDSDTVILRGLTVNNQGGGGNGVVFNSGSRLHVESCIINGFSAYVLASGLKFLGQGTLEVKDCIARGNSVGILVHPSSGTAKAAIDQVRLEGGGAALIAREGSAVTVRNSLASANATDGFLAESETGGSVRLSLEGCTASNNGQQGIVAEGESTGPVDVYVERCVVYGNDAGILASSGSTGVATVRVSNSTVTANNTVGLVQLGSVAVLLSRGNNTVEGNGINTAGAIGSYSAK